MDEKKKREPEALFRNRDHMPLVRRKQTGIMAATVTGEGKERISQNHAVEEEKLVCGKNIPIIRK